MQSQYQGFRATRPVGRLCDPQKKIYEVYFLIYVGKECRPFRFKKGINKAKAAGERKANAEAYADVFFEALQNGWNPLQSRYPELQAEVRSQRSMTFADAIEYCLSEKSRNLARGSIYNYRGCVRVLKKASVNCGIANIKIKEIQRKDLRLVLDQAREENNWTAKYRNQNLDILKSLLSVLVDMDILEYNPALKIRHERQEERVPYERLTDTEKEMIVRHISDAAPDYLDFIYFIYDTGIRPKELLLIQLFDINLTKREIRVRAEVAKTNRERIIPITDDMLDILLRREIHSRDKNFYLFSKHKFAPGPQPYWLSAGARYWRKLVQRDLKIDKKLYSLKHLGADAKLLAGIDIRTLKSLYGHSSEQMTEKYLEQLHEIHKQKIIEKAPSFTAKVIKMKKAE